MSVIGLVIAALAAPAAQLPVSDRVPIYCLDSTGIYQPIQRTNYGRLKAAYNRQFGFRANLQRTSAHAGRLTFRGGQRNAETITYAVRPYNDGIALLRMTVRLRGASDDLTGNAKCWQTFGTVNG